MVSGERVHLGFTGVGNGDLGSGLAGLGAFLLNCLDNVHAVNDFAEDNVLAVEPRGDDSSDEELRAVCVGSGVGHGQESRLGVLKVEVLVGKLGAVDRLATGTVTGGEVTTLQHELGDNTVERRPLVTEAGSTGAQVTEVLGGLGHYIVVELEGDAAERLAILGKVKEYVGHDSSSRREFASKGRLHRQQKREYTMRE